MTLNTMKTIQVISILLAALLFASCRSTTRTKIFILTEDDNLQRMGNANVKFELRPLTLPSYLNRREFIKRVGDDEIQILQSCLWAETSEHSINTVFRHNLKTLMGEDNVLPYGSASKTIPVLHISVRSLEVKDDTFIADFRCRLQADGKPPLEKRLVWQAVVKQDVPYVRYYKQAMTELAKQTANWLAEQNSRAAQ